MNITNTETGEVTTLDLQSNEIGELAKALAKAQGLMTSAQKDRQNPYFKSSYATLDSVWQAIRKPLADNGLSVVQTLLPDNTLVTVLLHESGQWLRSYLRLNPVKNDPQGVGSALTYGRRYCLAAIVGISQADDDGEDASQPTGKPANGKKQEAEPHPSGYSEASQPGNVWMPTVDEFFEHVQNELHLEAKDAKAILKEAGYSGFKREQATEMYKAIEREKRVVDEAAKVKAQVANGQPLSKAA